MRRAQDGLPARVSGPWTREKLTYVEKYASAFMKAMAPKRKAGKWSELVYLDLLAGPGRGIDRDSGAALRRRIMPADSSRADFRVGDCNAMAKEVVTELSGRALGLAFVDPQGFEATFRLFRSLATRRIDVLFLFPSGIGIVRNLRKFARQARSPMDDLWGGREWRELPPAKLAAGTKLSPEDAVTLDRPWVLGFRAKMASIGFRCQDEADPCFTNDRNVPMYHLLFFSQDPAGLTLWRGIKKIEPSGQRTLPF